MTLFGLKFNKEKAKEAAIRAARKGGEVLQSGARKGGEALKAGAKKAGSEIRNTIAEKKAEKRELKETYNKELRRQKILAAKRRAREDAGGGQNKQNNAMGQQGSPYDNNAFFTKPAGAKKRKSSIFG